MYTTFMGDVENQKTCQIPAMLAKAGQIATMELEDDETDTESDFQREVEGWKTFCKTFEKKLELLRCDNVDWLADAKKYEEYVQYMHGQ